MKKLPAPDVPSTGSSFDLVAGACYKAIHDVVGGRLMRGWRLPEMGSEATLLLSH